MRAFFTTAFLLAILFGFQLDADAQKAMRRYDSIPVIHGTDTLAFPWVGGLNSPQFGHVYLDGDTFPDLVVFDRGYFASSRYQSGHRLLTFINNGIANEASYTYAPRYESWFPKVNHWMLLRDFNCDGISDIVTYGDTSFNEYWLYVGNRVNDSLYYTYRGELWCTDGYNIPSKINDIPAILDVNGDGDLDMLMFENWTGAVVQYFENTSVEGGGSCGDSISFDLITSCWGGFEESPLNNQIRFNQPCLFPLEPGATGNNGPGSGRHVDGTLVDLDVDGNGYTDLLLGDPAYPTMTLIVNGQPNTNALMVPPSDSLFPRYDTTITIRNFPMAFHLDVDNDNRKDLMVCNNFTNRFEADDPVWFYKDVSTTDSIRFNLQNRDFMKDEMIDLGFGASPAFVDVNADSLLDLVIGNFSQSVDTTGFQASLHLYLNVGTAEVPAFELQDDNWLNISGIRPANPYYSLKPCFADLDGDDDKDLLLGEANGTILYFENTAAAGAPAVYTLAEDSLGGIDVGSMSAPFVYDVNGDQVPDLLVGRIQGNIHYFQNRGTATAPVFDPVPSNFFFGQIDAFAGAAAYDGHSAPVITTLDDTSSVLYLLSGNDDGHIVGYAFDADSIISGSMTKLFDKYSGIDVGERSTIAIADLTNDGKWEMVVGSYRGGLQFYTLSDSIAAIDTSDTTGIGFMDVPLPGVEVYPNPVQNTLQVSWDNISSEYLYISIINLSGKILHQRTELSVSGSGISTVDLSDISGGIYICRVTSGGRSVNKKIIVLQE